MDVRDVVKNVGLAALLALGPEVWAAPTCYPGAPLKDKSGTIQGCLYETWSANTCPNTTTPGAMLPVSPHNNGYCLACLYEPYHTSVSSGNWGGLQPNNFTCLSCMNKPSGVVGWWSFDETPLYSESYDLSAGDTVNIDNRLATIHPGPAVSIAGEVQRAWELDGVDDYVEVADHPSLNFGQNIGFSFEGWVRLSGTVNYDTSFVLLDKRVHPSASSLYYGYHIALQHRNMVLQLANGSWYNSTSPFQIPNNDEWHHIAVTVDRSSSPSIRFYLDGAVFTPSNSNPIGQLGDLTNTANLRFGRSSLSSSGSIKMGMDEFALYNRMLTSGEIHNIYIAGRFGGCKNFWPDDDAWWPGQ